MTEYTSCPEPGCGMPAEIVDRYWCEGSPVGVWMVATHCAANHRYCADEKPTASPPPHITH